MDKQEHLQRLRASRERLEKAISRLNTEQLTRPGSCGGVWSVKDVLGHVVYWETDLLDGYAALQRGEPVREYTDEEIHEINARVRWSTFTQPLETVVTEFNRSHQQILVWLEALPEQDLARPYAYGRTLSGFIPVDTWEHYDEHAVMVEGVDQ